MTIELVALDGDDTLWDNEAYFRDVEARYQEMLAGHAPADEVSSRLIHTERKNLGLFGYGAKGFVLSLIETAVEITDSTITAAEIHTIIGWGKEMLAKPVELLPGVGETIAMLAEGYRLVIVTKGDLLHQELKVAGSGLVDLLDGVEIVSEKDEATYRRIIADYRVDPARFVMVGNSVKSDVLPAVAAGARAIHLPYRMTWELEQVAEANPETHGYVQIDRFADLPEAISAIA